MEMCCRVAWLLGLLRADGSLQRVLEAVAGMTTHADPAAVPDGAEDASAASFEAVFSALAWLPGSFSDPSGVSTALHLRLRGSFR
jgi:hypothetical protein